MKSTTTATTTTVLFVTICFCTMMHQVQSNWWSLGLQTSLISSSFHIPEHNLADFCEKNPAMSGLTAGQKKLCELYSDHMPAVSKGARIGIVECQYQFRYQQWNCSAISNSSVFGPSIEKTASRESAFVRAISAAGVLQSIGRSCRNGDISSCSCSTSKRPANLNIDWVWGGCGDNVEYGYKFTKAFVDISEKSLSDAKKNMRLLSTSLRHRKLLRNRRRQLRQRKQLRRRRLRSRLARRNGAVADQFNGSRRELYQLLRKNNKLEEEASSALTSTLAPVLGADQLLEMRREQQQLRRNKARRLMNLHNNEAGRRAVYRLVKIECKCHGVSGSCSMKTCWLKLPSFREVGDYLKDKYDSAIEVRYQSRKNELRARHRRYSKPTKEDLIYIEDSPNYCNANYRYGLLGTRGRQCNKNSNGPDGCRIMCCGRGYFIKKTIKEEKCKCKFQWCCSVKCETCITEVETYVCK